MWKVLDAEKTARLLGYRDLAQEVGAVLSLRAAGRAWAPERQATPLAGGGVLLTMPASDGSCAVVKLITVHPDNPRQGLPAIQGEVVVLDAADGRRRCVLDGSAVTARRTAAVSLLAAMAPCVTSGGAAPGDRSRRSRPGPMRRRSSTDWACGKSMWPHGPGRAPRPWLRTSACWAPRPGSWPIRPRRRRMWRWW